MVPTWNGPQAPPRAAHAFCKRTKPRPLQAPPLPGSGSGSGSASGGGGEKPQLQLRLEPRSLGSAGDRAAVTAEPPLPWPGPQHSWADHGSRRRRRDESGPCAPFPSLSGRCSAHPLAPPRGCRRSSGSTQVSASEEAEGKGSGGRAWGIGRPRPTQHSRPRCGGASWPLRPAARTAPAKPAASPRVSNGTGRRSGWGSRPTAAPWGPRRRRSPPSSGLASPLAARPPSRQPGFLPAADTQPGGLTSGCPPPRPDPSGIAARRPGVAPCPGRSSSGLSPSAQLTAHLGFLGLGFVVRPPPFFLGWGVGTWVTGLPEIRAGRSLRPCCSGGVAARSRGAGICCSRSRRPYWRAHLRVGGGCWGCLDCWCPPRGPSPH